MFRILVIIFLFFTISVKADEIDDMCVNAGVGTIAEEYYKQRCREEILRKRNDVNKDNAHLTNQTAILEDFKKKRDALIQNGSPEDILDLIVKSDIHNNNKLSGMNNPWHWTYSNPIDINGFYIQPFSDYTHVPMKKTLEAVITKYRDRCKTKGDYMDCLKVYWVFTRDKQDLEDAVKYAKNKDRAKEEIAINIDKKEFTIDEFLQSYYFKENKNLEITGNSKIGKFPIRINNLIDISPLDTECVPGEIYIEEYFSGFLNIFCHNYEGTFRRYNCKINDSDFQKVLKLNPNIKQNYNVSKLINEICIDRRKDKVESHNKTICTQFKNMNAVFACEGKCDYIHSDYDARQLCEGHCSEVRNDVYRNICQFGKDYCRELKEDARDSCYRCDGSRKWIAVYAASGGYGYLNCY